MKAIDWMREYLDEICILVLNLNVCISGAGDDNARRLLDTIAGIVNSMKAVTNEERMVALCSELLGNLSELRVRYGDYFI